MRNLEDIEKDLAAAREALSSVEGTPAEVYSRIVGYYRSVRNWNRGKREEYGERRLFRARMDSIRTDTSRAAAASPIKINTEPVQPAFQYPASADGTWIMLFVRSSCPGCIAAKAAAAKLGIPVHLIDTDTAVHLRRRPFHG